MKPCAHPRCDFPVGGVGARYGLCVQHGHEERDRRLRERDAQVRAAAPPAPLRPNLSPTLPRPLSAIVGVRPVPVTIQPSAATVAAKETPVSKPMTLAPDADAHPERCRIAKCTRPPRGRGLCNAHVQRAYREHVVDTLGLPSKTPYKAASARKPVAPTAPKPTPPTEPRLSRSEQQIAEQQAHQEELEKLRAERDAAITRAERAEKERADLQTQLEDIEQSDRDLLDESIEVARVLEIDTGGDYDVLARAREVMAELADVRANHAKAQPWLRAAKTCAEALGVTTPEELIEGAKALALDQHPPASVLGPDAIPWYNAARACADVLGIDTPEALVKRARDSVEPPPTAVRCGSVQVFEVGGEPPTATLIGDQDAVRALARLGLYRECGVYEIELGVLLRKAKG